MYQTHVFLIIKNSILIVFSFTVALIIAPFLIKLLYKYKCWKKKPREETLGGDKTPIFNSFHKEKEISVPRMGGILIWVTVGLIALITYFFSVLFPNTILGKLNFLSRKETWLPLFTLISSSILGLIDDILVIRNKGKYIGGGMRFKVRLALITLIALAGAWWFYAKLGWSSIYIPFYGNVEIDGFYIPLFILVILATFSSSVIDGLDGLSAGSLIPIFLAFGVISYTRGLYDLVGFLVVLIGAMITYLWFNVPPAKFYMGETGIMGLTVTLAVIAFLTNSVLFLPVIGFVLVLESASVIIQLISKRFFKRKVFLSAPIHHHLQAIGWTESQITMRFWIISGIFSLIGITLFFLAKFW
jgi:phospho-N-acetylmuramoyl-pentapeptide-transferase